MLRWISIRQLAKSSGLGREALERAINSGQLKAFRMGRTLKTTDEEFERFSRALLYRDDPELSPEPAPEPLSFEAKINKITQEVLNDSSRN